MTEGHERIHLSIANVAEEEAQSMLRALSSGWVAPLGPEVDAFEVEVSSFVGRAHAVALSSGTAALQLAYKYAGVGFGGELVMPTLTFGATAFPAVYLGAKPVFLDVDPDSWTLDLNLLAGWLRERARAKRLPAAIVPVDLFGVPCQYNELVELASHYGVPLIADAAEALGAHVGNRRAGAFGDAAVLSFNGNKIMTTSGGGMYLTDSREAADKVRFWATQSREPFAWYEHAEIGYNFRMSNLLAALGRVQLQKLPSFVERRRQIRDLYKRTLGSVPGVTVLGDPAWGTSNGWLTTVLMDHERYPDGPDTVREALLRANIESRPIWKPLHAQPVFRGAESALTGVANRVFRDGLCLPSGSGLSDEQIHRVAAILTQSLAGIRP